MLIRKNVVALTFTSLMLASVASAQVLKIPDVPRDKVICFALYTVHDNVLKLTAQLYPLKDGEDRTARLEIMENGEWMQAAEAQVIERGWTATFRVEGWDSTRDAGYRVAHGESAHYTGSIRKDPVDKETVVVAAFTGNSIYPGDGGDLPRDDIVENIKKLNPDLLFFSGDQVYDHHKHYAYWLKFGRDFGEIMRDRPTVTIPDDHDVGQHNLWGSSGKKSKSQLAWDGGYVAPVEYVREVERAQTSHLPDPYDPTPIRRGIGVYYTSLTLGRISFAIIEDRKFKSAPLEFFPPKTIRPDLITDANYRPEDLDAPGAVLLGERQLKFLGEWAADWRGSDMKTVLSQTIFAGAAHLHGGKDVRAFADLDTNGWPQTGRNRALREIRKGFAFMLAGDQHLGTLIHHGVDDWNDSGYSFSVPSIANLYLRWWDPLEPGGNREPGAPEYTGEHLDGFGNKITMLAAANPSKEKNHDKLTTRAAGFGVVTFNKKTREITVECWPRNVDITAPESKQYPGWPRTLTQEDNYGRAAAAYLPAVEVSGMTNPVVQVIDESNGEIVYTIRINGTSYKPKVFKEGIYTIKVGEQGGKPGTEKMKTLAGVQSLAPEETKTLSVEF